MNAFDTSIVDLVNRFARHSHVFDRSVVFLGGHDLVKGGAMMALLWWAWFACVRSGKPERRAHLISALIMGVAAVVVARGMAHELPFRQRPFAVRSFHFIKPYGSNNKELDDWSSFPSDHAALFLAIAVGILYASRPAGIVALLCATFGICLPRLYLGIHWPTDLLAGAALGIGAGWAGAQPLFVRRISTPLLTWFEREPAWSYMPLFLLTYQIATLFNDSRDAVHFALHTAKDVLAVLL